MNRNLKAAALALLAALFYALNTPVSALLLAHVPAAFMAAFLYLGAGIGIGLLYLPKIKNEPRSERLEKRDLPYTVGMIVLDIAAPILLMLGIRYGSAANASLLGNFEIVATALIALLLFGEKVSPKLWAAVVLITLASAVLSFEGSGSFRFSVGSLLVVAAASCWGLENNCTRSISEKSTYEIVVLKGFFSGGGSFLVALLSGESLPAVRYILPTLLLGFVAFGLSIFLYIRAQRDLGAARTGAYYAAAPFIGMLLSFVLTGERPSLLYAGALALMIAGTVFVVKDTMQTEA